MDQLLDLGREQRKENADRVSLIANIKHNLLQEIEQFERERNFNMIG